MEYNKIIITNLPAFYKINLYNRIADKEKILVIFTGSSAEIRNADFFKENLIKFDYIKLKDKSAFYRMYLIVVTLIRAEYQELILGGWDELLIVLSSLLSSKSKNAVIVESSIYESKTTGFKGLIKKIFLKRIGKAYASGNSQIQLLKELDFTGKIFKTKGVGLFNVLKQPDYEERNKVIDFLYVGRLSEEKKLDTLIKNFLEFPYLRLHIVGFGPQEEYLKSIAGENIYFHGAVKNNELYRLYRKYDVFVLPSIAEPWGLVVEEALNNGMPVIVSNRVGCADEIVEKGKNGLIFDIKDENSLKDAIHAVTDLTLYNSLRKNAAEMNFETISQEQVNVYHNC